MPSHDPSSKGPGRTGGGGVLATNGMADIDYKHVFLKAGVAMAIADTDGLLVDCNPSFYEASGIPEAQIATVSMFALISPEQLPQTYNWVALVLHERQGEATTLSRRAAFKKNGRDMSVSMSFVRNEGNQPLFFHLALVEADTIGSEMPHARGREDAQQHQQQEEEHGAAQAHHQQEPPPPTSSQLQPQQQPQVTGGE
mmetsp:Transcript_66248/g.182891  ORF Transcript_66248/g.182891 Transcript_66248/m.182891 type:complete len:198 (+) Transcript_66248:1146-1739(+)